MEKMLKDKKIIALFILPAFLLFITFIPIPLVSSLVLSTYKWNMLQRPRFIGALNFIRLFTQDNVYLASIGHTFHYLFLSIILQIPMAYFLAILLTRNSWGDKFFRNMIFMPVTFSGTIVSLMFYLIYHGRTGIINSFIRLFGNPEFDFAWLAEKSTAMTAVCFAVAWQYVGYHLVIFITGITGISNDTIDAAKIDGASTAQIAWHITTPLMKPVLNVSLVLITTSSLKGFDSIYVMTGGGPMHATEVMASHMYFKSFTAMDYGYGCAIGLLLFVACILFTGAWSFVFRSKNAEGAGE